MKKYFITGLVILLPLAMTIAIVVFIVNFLTKPFIGIVVKTLSQTRMIDLGTKFLSSEQLIKIGSQLIILVGLFLFTLLLGFLARWIFINFIIKLSDNVLHRIPLVNKVYKTSKEIIETLFITDKNSFKQVVLCPFPSKETYCVGLISRAAPAMCQNALNAEMISVFVPTTPNPTTGFLVMYKKEDLIYLDMKTEEAVKYIVSCGVILPENKGLAK